MSRKELLKGRAHGRTCASPFSRWGCPATKAGPGPATVGSAGSDVQGDDGPGSLLRCTARLGTCRVCNSGTRRAAHS